MQQQIKGLPMNDTQKKNLYEKPSNRMYTLTHTHTEVATNKTSLNNSTAKHIDFCRHFCWCSGIIPKCLVYIVKHCLWPCRTRNEEKWHIHHVSILCRFYFFLLK